jgi:hypothetical protein
MKYLIIIAFVFSIPSANAYDAKTKEHMKVQQQLSTEQYPGGPTLGKCLAAIDDAKRHANEWQADFSIKECADIAAKSIDNGMLLMDDATRDQDQ